MPAVLFLPCAWHCSTKKEQSLQPEMATEMGLLQLQSAHQF